MDARLDQFLKKLAIEPDFAERFYADRVAVLAEVDLDEADRFAVASMDDERLAALLHPSTDPPVAPEHPTSARTARWATPALALSLCVAYVVLWTFFAGVR